jgi:hypothetical protein
VLARIARPTFPWPPIDSFVDEMVDRIMAFHRSLVKRESTALE